MTFFVKVNRSETTTPQYKDKSCPSLRDVRMYTVSLDSDSLTRTGSTDRHASTLVFSMCFLAKSDFKITCSRRSDSRAQCSDGGERV